MGKPLNLIVKFRLKLRYFFSLPLFLPYLAFSAIRIFFRVRREGGDFLRSVYQEPAFKGNS